MIIDIDRDRSLKDPMVVRFRGKEHRVYEPEVRHIGLLSALDEMPAERFHELMELVFGKEYDPVLNELTFSEFMEIVRNLVPGGLEKKGSRPKSDAQDGTREISRSSSDAAHSTSG